MKTDDLQSSFVKGFETLLKARTQQRQADDEVRRVTAELDALRLKIAAQPGLTDLAQLVRISELTSW